VTRFSGWSSAITARSTVWNWRSTSAFWWVSGSVVGVHSRPDEAAPRIVAHFWVGIAEFVLQSLEGLVIQLELALEGAIGHTAPLAQQGNHLIHERDKVHSVSSLLFAVPIYTCATLS
jgi:hypothetical protein